MSLPDTRRKPKPPTGPLPHDLHLTLAEVCTAADKALYQCYQREQAVPWAERIARILDLLSEVGVKAEEARAAFVAPAPASEEA